MADNAAAAGHVPAVLSSLYPPPSSPRRLTPFRFHLLLHALLLSSLVYLFLLPHHPLIAQRLYTDENAWLANNARPSLTSSHYHLAQSTHLLLCHSPPADRGPALRAHWQSLGLDVHLHSHIHPPSSRYAGAVTPVTYAIVEAALSDGKEAVALVVDLDISLSSPSPLALSAPAVVTALASLLSSSPWLARDHVLIAVEHHHDRIRAAEALAGWLQHYRAPGDDLNASYTERPFRRSGQLLAAVVLDLPFAPQGAGAYSAFTVHVGGHQGLSPNLDVVAVALRLMQDHGVKVGVAGGSGVGRGVKAAWAGGFDEEYAGLWRSAVHHVTGEATGYHGAFIRHNVDALTIAALPGKGRKGGEDGVRGLMGALDGYLRALNNLIEKLHHSTWLYLLLSPTHFVTMSRYIYGFGMLMAPVPLLALWQLYGQETHDWMGAGGAVMGVYAACLLPVGVMRGLSPQVYLQWSPMLPVGTVMVGVGVAVWVVGRVVRSGDWRTLHALVLLVSFLVLSPLAILNFPLAVAMTALVTPLGMWGRGGGTGLAGWGRWLWGVGWLAALSPVTLGWVYARYWGLQGWQGWHEALETAVYGDHLLYLLLPGVYLPLYLLSWAVLLMPSSPRMAVTIEKKAQ